MNPTGVAASCWYHGKLESLIKRWAIPRGAAMTLGHVIKFYFGPAGCHITKYIGASTCCLRMRSLWHCLYECCVYLLHSLRFVADLDHCPATLLNASAHRVLSHPILVLSILTSHIDVACLMLPYTDIDMSV